MIEVLPLMSRRSNAFPGLRAALRNEKIGGMHIPRRFAALHNRAGQRSKAPSQPGQRPRQPRSEDCRRQGALGAQCVPSWLEPPGRAASLKREDTGTGAPQ